MPMAAASLRVKTPLPAAARKVANIPNWAADQIPVRRVDRGLENDVLDGEVGEQGSQADGHQQERFKLLDHGEVNEHADDHPHHNHLPK